MSKLTELLQKIIDGQTSIHDQLGAILTAVSHRGIGPNSSLTVAEWMTVEQAAQFAGVSTKTIRRAIRKGELAASNVRGSSRRPTWRIKRSDLEGFMKNNEARNVLPASSSKSGGKYQSRHFPDL
jgi:excisionase family DNA binding protein